MKSSYQTAAERREQARFHREVRGRLMLRGESIKSWAAAHGYLRPTVQRAVQGNRLGPVSRAIRERLRRELEIAQGER